MEASLGVSQVAQLERWVAELEQSLKELSARLPAHSLSPALQAEMDDLDSQLVKARRELAEARRGSEHSGT